MFLKVHKYQNSDDFIKTLDTIDFDYIGMLQLQSRFFLSLAEYMYLYGHSVFS